VWVLVRVLMADCSAAVGRIDLFYHLTQSSQGSLYLTTVRRRCRCRRVRREQRDARDHKSV
jgi:hypothetical protein